MFSRLPLVRALLCLGFLVPSLLLAATIEVTHGGDAGPGSLRQAILEANASPAADWIRIPCDLGIIAPLSALPEITATVAIESSCNPWTEPSFPTIDGSGAGDADGLVASAPLRLFYVDITRFARTGLVLRGHRETVVVGSRIDFCRRGIEIHGGGGHVLSDVETSDHAEEGLLAIDSHANVLGNPDHCGIPEGCAYFGPNLEFSGFFPGRVTARRNGRGVVVSGEFNEISAIASENHGDGIVLDGSTARLSGRASDNGGVGLRATGSHAPSVFTAGNGGGARALDGESVSIDVTAASWLDEHDGTGYTTTLVSGTLTGLPDRTYRLDVLPADPPPPGWTPEPYRLGTTVRTDAAGRAAFSFVPLYHVGAGVVVPSLQSIDATGIPLMLFDEVEGSVAFPASEVQHISGGDLAVHLEGPEKVRQGEPFRLDVVLTADAQAATRNGTFRLTGAEIESFGRITQWFGHGPGELFFYIAPGQTLRWPLLVSASHEGEVILEGSVSEWFQASDADPSNDRAQIRIEVGPAAAQSAAIATERLLRERLRNGLLREVWQIRNEGDEAGFPRFPYPSWSDDLVGYGYGCSAGPCELDLLGGGGSQMFVIYRWGDGAQRKRPAARSPSDGTGADDASRPEAIPE